MKVQVSAHSVDDIINLFPSDSIYVEVEKSEVENLVNDIMSKIKTYNDISSLVYEYLKKNVYDERCYYMTNKHTPEEYAEHIFFDIWRHGYWEYKQEEYEKYNVPLPDENFICVNDWVKIFEDYILETRGQIRTYEEAAELAADTWIDRVFRHCVQDPDQLSSVKSTAGIAPMLATLLKEDTIRDISEQQIIAFREEIKKYYLNENKESEYKYYRYFLSTDYYPDENLRSIFEKVGISKDVMNKIAPWKTIIGIDVKDNSVRLNHSYF